MPTLNLKTTTGRVISLMMTIVPLLDASEQATVVPVNTKLFLAAVEKLWKEMETWVHQMAGATKVYILYVSPLFFVTTYFLGGRCDCRHVPSLSNYHPHIFELANHLMYVHPI